MLAATSVHAPNMLMYARDSNPKLVNIQESIAHAVFMSLSCSGPLQQSLLFMHGVLR
jgi:hypothetical protein